MQETKNSLEKACTSMTRGTATNMSQHNFQNLKPKQTSTSSLETHCLNVYLWLNSMFFSHHQSTNPTTKPGVPKAVPALGSFVGWTWHWQKPMLPLILYSKRVRALPAAVPSRWVTSLLEASTDLCHLHFWNWQKKPYGKLSVHTPFLPGNQTSAVLLHAPLSQGMGVILLPSPACPLFSQFGEN